MNPHHQTYLGDVLDAILIESPSHVSFNGHPVPIRPTGPQRPRPDTEPPSNGGGNRAPAIPENLQDAVAALQIELYQQAYTAPFSGTRRPVLAPGAPDAVFLAALTAANTTTERWESEWTLETIDPQGLVTARKRGGWRQLRPGQYAPMPPAGLAPGAPLQVLATKGSFEVQPGFYVVFAEASAPMPPALSPLIRLYFNISAAGAPQLVEALTGHLNRYQAPFSFKILSQPAHIPHRTDAAVLFLNRRYFHVAAELAESISEELGDHLEGGTPLFSKALAPGIGMAEDPGDGNSFGLSRCRILSEAIWLAWLGGETTGDARLRRIEKRFEAVGLDIDQPHLNEGSSDAYHLPHSAGGP